MNRVFEQDESIFEPKFPPVFSFRWPGDFRKVMFWIFAASAVGFLALALYRLPHLRNAPIWSLLIGPVFEVNGAALCVIAAWTLWKAHPWARGWAIAASLLYPSMYFRPVHVTWLHNVISLGVGLIGLAAFLWPDRNETLNGPEGRY